MKARTLEKLIIIEAVVIKLILIWILFQVLNNNKTELLREISPDGDYVLIIQEIGKPSVVFSGSFHTIDLIEVKLFENNSHEHYGVSFEVFISTGNIPAKCEIEWMEDGVQIVLCGYKSQYYILPFKTLEDANRLLQ